MVARNLLEAGFLAEDPAERRACFSLVSWSAVCLKTVELAGVTASSPFVSRANINKSEHDRWAFSVGTIGRFACGANPTSSRVSEQPSRFPAWILIFLKRKATRIDHWKETWICSTVKILAVKIFLNLEVFQISLNEWMNSIDQLMQKIFLLLLPDVLYLAGAFNFN